MLLSPISLFAQIRKVDEERRLVYGRLTQELADKTGEMFDYEASKPYFKSWIAESLDMSNGKFQGNMRSMHGSTAAGGFVEIILNDEEKAVDVVGKVVDDQEWKKVLEGVYTGYSLGGRRVGEFRPVIDGLKTVMKYTVKPHEGSLVDRPCVPTARFFEIQKADGSVIEQEFKSEKGGDMARGDNEVKKLVLVSDATIAGEIKKYAGEEVWDTSQALSALNIIYDLLIKEMGEDHPEAESQVADLKMVVERLKSFIASEIQEASVEAVAEMTEKISKLESVIAQHAIEKAEGASCTACGTSMKCEKCSPSGDVQKVEEKEEDKKTGEPKEADPKVEKSLEKGGIEDMNEEDIRKMIGAALEPVVKENAELKDKIAKLEAGPGVSKGLHTGATTTVEKEDDKLIQKREPEVVIEDPMNIKKLDRPDEAQLLIRKNVQNRAGARSMEELRALGLQH